MAVSDEVGGLLHFEIVLIDVGTVVDAGDDAMPLWAFVVPDVVEEAGLAAGRRHDPDFAVGSAYRGADGPIDGVLYERGFVDDQYLNVYMGSTGPRRLRLRSGAVSTSRNL